MMKKNNLMHFRKLSQHPEVCHFTTTRRDGNSEANYASFNLSFYSGDNPSTVAFNRQLLCDDLGIAPDRLIVPFQTHSNRVEIIDESFDRMDFAQRSVLLDGVDSLITRTPRFCIGVTTADCVPILLYDPVQHAVAAIHAGWRGTVALIASNTVQAMVNHFGTEPSSLIAGIGPSISPDSFEVGEEVAQEFRAKGFSDSVLEHFPKPHIDLWKANRQDLMNAGVKAENIEISAICTYENHETFFSARRLGIKSGRFITGIMIK